MRITVIADPVLPVPPRGYGGAERFIACLCQALCNKGHHVTLVARDGSQTYGRLIKHRAPDNRRYLSRAFRKLLFQPTSLNAALHADVVHNFGRVDYLWALLRTKRPLVHTFENPITAPEVDFFARRMHPCLTLVSVSRHQRERFDSGLKWDTVHNAVDVDRMRFSPMSLNPPYLAFLGRLTENKGVHLAIQVARKAGIPLKIAGNISREPGGAEYFENRVRPELHDDVEWVGELDDEKKIPFLGGALALLFPIQWDEPFAVVLGESLACGTPVIATRRASTPEAVRHGLTGFLCETSEEMVAAIGRVHQLKREDCRAFAMSALSADVAADRYLEIYRETAHTC